MKKILHLPLIVALITVFFFAYRYIWFSIETDVRGRVPLVVFMVLVGIGFSAIIERKSLGLD
jgi:hypothetical protein